MIGLEQASEIAHKCWVYWTQQLINDEEFMKFNNSEFYISLSERGKRIINTMVHAYLKHSNTTNVKVRNKLREYLISMQYNWVNYYLANKTEENIKRWTSQINTPYKNLTEKDKDKDRKFGIDILNILE